MEELQQAIHCQQPPNNDSIFGLVCQYVHPDLLNTANWHLVVVSLTTSTKCGYLRQIEGVWDRERDEEDTVMMMADNNDMMYLQ